MSNFEWWTAALKGTRGPIHDGEPMHGFYRQRQQGKDRRTQGPFEPVAYWQDEATGELRCQVNGKSINMQRALEMWPYVSKNPITAESYWHFMDTGKWMDGDDHAAATAKGPEIDPATDPVGSMRSEIEAARAGVPAYKTIESDEQAAKGQTLRSALTALSGKADKIRAAEKEPHLQASREVDAKYQPLVKSAKEGADEIRRALETWENTKREAARRAADEAARKQREYEAAARKAEEANQPAPEPPPPSIVNTPAPSAQIKGASGRTASVSTKPFVVSIDIDKFIAQFRSDPNLTAALMELAQKYTVAGIKVDGAVIEERAVVR